MENLIAVFSTLKKNTIRYGWAWAKQEKDAVNNSIKKMEVGETLVDVWVCKWRDAPSKYTLVKGFPTTGNAVPSVDFADNIRKQFLKQPKPNRWAKTEKQKPHIRIKPEAPTTEPATKPYRMFITKEATA